MSHNAGDAIRRENLTVLLGRKETGDQCIHPHPLRCPLAGEVLGEVMHRRFGRGVGEHAGQRHQPGHRAKIDDRATLSVFDQVPPENLTAQKHAANIHCDDPVKFIVRDLQEWRRGICPSSVHDNINPARPLQHLRQKTLKIGPAARFCRHEVASATGLRDRLETSLRLLRITSHQHDLRTGSSKATRHRAAQFPGTANDDRNFAVQTEQRVKIGSRTHPAVVSLETRMSNTRLA